MLGPPDFLVVLLAFGLHAVARGRVGPRISRSIHRALLARTRRAPRDRSPGLLLGGVLALGLPAAAAALVLGIPDGPVGAILKAAALALALDPGPLGKPGAEEGAVGPRVVEGVDRFVAGFVTPLVFAMLLGVPGAVFARAATAIAAVIGHHGRDEYLGRVAARLDDMVGWVPARVGAAALLLAGGLLERNVRRGASVLRRDGGNPESPNRGRPRAAVAGLLGVRLEREGRWVLGDGRAPEEEDVAGTRRLLRAAAGLVGLAALLLAAL